MSGSEVLVGLLAGAVAALLTALLTPWLQVVFAPRAQRIAAHFAAAERAAIAHRDAASKLSSDVAEIYTMLEGIYANFDVRHGSGDYWPPSGIPVGSYQQLAGEAAKHLQRVWTTHPTADVRRQAKSLWADLTAFWGEGTPGAERPIATDADQLWGHVKSAEALVESLHTPVAVPEYPTRPRWPVPLVVAALGLLAALLIFALTRVA
jgi:hypothetical protein